MINKIQVQQIIENESEGPTLDYKEDLCLQTDGDKAQFIKDVLSLANSGQMAHIIVGFEDGSRKLIGIKTKHKPEQLNDILKNRCDPPITVEYSEKNILCYEIGTIEFNGVNPPYIVSVTDQYGGPLSNNPQKIFNIYRGMVFVRNFNKNEGASRADLDKMFKTKYISLQAELELTHEAFVKARREEKEVEIKFVVVNSGEVISTDTYILIFFKNIKKISELCNLWKNISQTNQQRPTISTTLTRPVVRNVRSGLGRVKVVVDPDIYQIETVVIIGATNMRTKQGPYVISLKGVTS